jgi:hypothetical protein
VPPEDDAFTIEALLIRFPARHVGYDSKSRVIADVVLPDPRFLVIKP